MLGMSVPSVKTPQFRSTGYSPLLKALSLSLRVTAGVSPVTDRASMPCFRNSLVRLCRWARSTQKAKVDFLSLHCDSQARTVIPLVSAVLTALERSPTRKSPLVAFLTREMFALDCTVVKMTSESHFSLIMSA